MLAASKCWFPWLNESHQHPFAVPSKRDGQPHEFLCDPARTNLADALTTPSELAGSVIHVTAADAHYQLGWFNQVLEKVIYDCSPSDQETWTECIHAAHCKNELIQAYGMTPAQFIFGRNPKISENLMDEPCEFIPATASLYEAEIAKRVAIRQAARQAVVEMQDSKALRFALAARPRHQSGQRPQKNASWCELHMPSC